MNVLYVGQQKQEVAFTAAVGHIYLLNEVFEINGPSIDKKRKSEKHGHLIVVDATDRAAPKIVGVGQGSQKKWVGAHMPRFLKRNGSSRPISCSTPYAIQCLLHSANREWSKRGKVPLDGGDDP